jgi:2-oxoglutarate dehydrogenase E1 component
MNQGAWYAIWHHLNHCAPAGKSFRYAGSPPAAAPASGYAARHKTEMDAMLKQALEE